MDAKREGVLQSATGAMTSSILHGDRRATLTLASRSDRLFGQCIDGFVGGLPLLLVMLLTRLFHAGGFFMVPAALWAAFYYLFADGLPGGQSLGKKWIGMYVIDEKSGEPCTWGDSLVRNLFGALGLIDWLFIFGEKHQRLGDKVAGTIVVLD